MNNSEIMLMKYEWNEIAKKLSLRVCFDHKLTLKNGKCLIAAVLLNDFGAREGMLIFDPSSKVFDYSDEVISLGYGYSILEPFNLEAEELEREVIELLADWGWSNKCSAQPNWL